MKSLFLFSILSIGFWILSLSCFAQAPQSFKYQAVARNSAGAVIANQQVSFKISLLSGSATGTQVYSEEFTVQTNAFGLVNLAIGTGSNPSGNFSALNWGTSSYYIKVELDAGSGYADMGTSQLLSVPYALYAPGNWTTSNTNIYNSNTGNVGIGTSTPAAKLDVMGSVRIKDDSEGAGKVLTSDANGNASWAAPALSGSTGNANFIPKFSTPASLTNSLMFQNGNKIGLGTITPSGRLQIQADSTAALTEPLFEIKDKHGKTVMVVYQDSVHFYVSDPANKAQTKGAFAVSGKSDVKGFTNNFLYITPDTSRIYTSDTTNGFKIQSILGGSPHKSYLNVSPLNYFIGHEAGASINGGLYNSFMGYQTGKNTVTGYKNTFMGYQSGFQNLSGSENVFIGLNSGFSNQGGSYNVFIGVNSGFSNTDGNTNTFLGMGSGYNNTTGSLNTFLGSESGYNNTDGSLNTFIGTNTGKANTTGSNNTFMGYGSGISNTTASNNTFVGSFSGMSNTEGYKNLFLGDETGSRNSTGYHNIFIGSMTGHENTAGNYNVFLGRGAGYYNTTGSSNIFIGSESGFFNTTADDNICIGRNTGVYLTTGWRNVFVGNLSGQNNTTGSKNAFFGIESGVYNTIGYSNSFFGCEAGRSITTGYLNSFFGEEAGRMNETGYGNCFYGYMSGKVNKGSGNLFIGTWSGFNNINGSDNVFIGTSAGYTDTTSGKLYIANNNQTLIYGDFNIGNIGILRTATANSFEVEGEASKTTAGAWLANSDRRIKTDIKDIENSYETILNLRPVIFKYTDEWKKKHPGIQDKYYYNFIAQEYQQVFPESVQSSGEFIEGDKKEILQIDTYNAQIVTIKAVQDLIKEVAVLKNENSLLKSDNTILKNDNTQLKLKTQEIDKLKAEIESIKMAIGSAKK